MGGGGKSQPLKSPSNTPLWDALLHMPKKRQRVVEVPLELKAIRQLRMAADFLTNLACSADRISCPRIGITCGPNLETLQ